MGKSTHDLRPGIYRPGATTSSLPLSDLENRMYLQFKLRSIPYLPAASPDQWELLFLMQHFRMPTRLLDWSENAFVALYFALESAHRDGFSADAVVWTLDPVDWNKHTYAGGHPPEEVLTTGDRRLTPYASPPDWDRLLDPPVAIYAPHSNARIVSQSGAFTVFGKSTDSMEVLSAAKSYPSSILVPIYLEQSKLQSMFDTLLQLGYTHSKIFPDLDGLASELRRSNGYPA
jgi:hypothetical protein